MTEKHSVGYVKARLHLSVLASLLFLTFLLLAIAAGTSSWVIADVQYAPAGSSVTTLYHVGLKGVSTGHTMSPMTCGVHTANSQESFLTRSCRELQTASSTTLAVCVLAILCSVAAGIVVARYLVKGKPLEGHKARLLAHALFACMPLFAVIGMVVYGASHRKTADYFTLLFNPASNFNVAVRADVRLGASYFAALVGTVLALVSSGLYAYILKHEKTSYMKAAAGDASAGDLEAGQAGKVQVTATPDATAAGKVGFAMEDSVIVAIRSPNIVAKRAVDSHPELVAAAVPAKVSAVEPGFVAAAPSTAAAAAVVTEVPINTVLAPAALRGGLFEEVAAAQNSTGTADVFISSAGLAGTAARAYIVMPKIRASEEEEAALPPATVAVRGMRDIVESNPAPAYVAAARILIDGAEYVAAPTLDKFGERAVTATKHDTIGITNVPAMGAAMQQVPFEAVAAEEPANLAAAISVEPGFSAVGAADPAVAAERNGTWRAVAAADPSAEAVRGGIYRVVAAADPAAVSAAGEISMETVASGFSQFPNEAVAAAEQSAAVSEGTKAIAAAEPSAAVSEGTKAIAAAKLSAARVVSAAEYIGEVAAAAEQSAAVSEGTKAVAAAEPSAAVSEGTKAIAAELPAEISEGTKAIAAELPAEISEGTKAVAAEPVSELAELPLEAVAAAEPSEAALSVGGVSMEEIASEFSQFPAEPSAEAEESCGSEIEFY